MLKSQLTTTEHKRVDAARAAAAATQEILCELCAPGYHHFFQDEAVLGECPCGAPSFGSCDGCGELVCEDCWDDRGLTEPLHATIARNEIEARRIAARRELIALLAVSDSAGALHAQLDRVEDAETDFKMQIDLYRRLIANDMDESDDVEIELDAFSIA